MDRKKLEPLLDIVDALEAELTYVRGLEVAVYALVTDLVISHRARLKAIRKRIVEIRQQ